MKNILFILLVSTILIGCSNQSLYQSGQNYKKNECMKDAQTAEQHNECINAERKTFKEYKKERESVVNK